LYDEGNKPVVKTEVEHNEATLFLDDDLTQKDSLRPMRWLSS
jgi:hypothetical protein